MQDSDHLHTLTSIVHPAIGCHRIITRVKERETPASHIWDKQEDAYIEELVWCIASYRDSIDGMMLFSTNDAACILPVLSSSHFLRPDPAILTDLAY